MRVPLIAGLAALALVATSLPGQAAPPWFRDNDIKYYWEIDPPGRGMPTFGWERTRQGLRINGPVVRKPGEALWSFCARQVGRIMRQDRADLMRSTQLTDGCVRRGGRY